MGIVLQGGPHDRPSHELGQRHVPLGAEAPTAGRQQAAGTRVASSPDSDLEAFSHNPAHGHAFTVRIRTGNQNQTSFYPSVPHEISVLVELILGTPALSFNRCAPQPNSPPDNVFRPDRPAERALGPKEGHCPASDSRNK
ncbi:hypothetical protein L6452_45067 [Arctium lappa]|nr:hypothetical protein L6452_45067 [Arctium lappa]